MKRIVIITSGHFPEGDAGAVRLLYMAKAMVDSGFDVTVLCRSKYQKGEIDGIKYVSFREKRGDIISKAIALLKFPSKAVKYLKSQERIDCVYFYNAPVSILEYCKRELKPKGVALIFDCVEWYSPEQFKNGEKNRVYRMKNHIITEVVDSSFSVIAISRYLENYFAEKGIRVMRVPILCDTAFSLVQKKCGEKLTLFYAGLPQSKDLVGNVLEGALLLSPEERSHLRIVLVGSEREHLISRCGIPSETLDACSDFLELYGRKPREDVLHMMESADFVMLIRDASLRYAKAGFPSKIVESLANATPVFCNISSDLGEYLCNGENALIVKSHKREDIAEAIRRGIALTAEQKQEMSRKALLLARERFDYHSYVVQIKDFLHN